MMKRFSKISTALGLILASMTSTSYAALINQGLTTLDDDTNLEWLDVTATANLSYDGAKASSFASTDGFRHATLSEITTLYTNAGITDFSGNLSAGNFSPAANIVTLLGQTATASTERLQQGWYDNGSSGATTSVAEVSAYFGFGGFGQVETPNTYPQTTYATTTSGIYGNYMVRSSVVPVPAAAWFFGSAIIGLAGIKRKK
jgi:hypothetical protein